jgi:hypothetical protein
VQDFILGVNLRMGCLERRPQTGLHQLDLHRCFLLFP